MGLPPLYRFVDQPELSNGLEPARRRRAAAMCYMQRRMNASTPPFQYGKNLPCFGNANLPAEKVSIDSNPSGPPSGMEKGMFPFPFTTD